MPRIKEHWPAKNLYFLIAEDWQELENQRIRENEPAKTLYFEWPKTGRNQRIRENGAAENLYVLMAENRQALENQRKWGCQKPLFFNGRKPAGIRELEKMGLPKPFIF